MSVHNKNYNKNDENNGCRGRSKYLMRTGVVKFVSYQVEQWYQDENGNRADYVF